MHKNVIIPGEDLNEFDIDLLVLSPLASKLVCIPGEKELPGENEGWWVNPDTFGEIDELWANEALAELIALKFCTWNWQKYQFIILVLNFLYFEDWSFWNGTDICACLCYVIYFRTEICVRLKWNDLSTIYILHYIFNLI